MSESNQNTASEIITVNVGGFGVNIGQSSLEHLCAEYGISSDGIQESKTKYSDSVHSSFKETSKGNYLARSLFFDLDPYTIEMLQSSYKYRNVLRDQYCVSGKYGVNNNFAAGHYTTGKRYIDLFNDKLRLIVEECDKVQGFIINNSVNGGTGSGTGSLILERIAVDYRRRTKIGFHSFADDKRVSSPLQIYSALLSFHWLLDHTEISFILDNAKLNEICRQQLGIKTPRYTHLNNICDKVISAVVAPARFGLRYDFKSFTVDMVPFPRLHFLSASLSPIAPKHKSHDNYKTDIQSLSAECFKYSNFLQRYGSFDVDEDKYMAMALFYRADNIDEYILECNQSMKYMTTNRKATFVDWSADCKPSVHCIDVAPVTLPSDHIMTDDKQVALVGNNTGISRIFSERICKKYDLLYSQRAYVYHMVYEGMEEGELCEAREDLGFLEKDYLDVVATRYDDEDDDDY